MNDEVKQNHTWKRVCIGDTVECYFDHDKNQEYKGIRQFRIIGCTKRFGTGASDLFHALPVDGYPIRIETLDRETFAGSYITKVIHHPKGATLTHAHHPQYHPKYKHVVFKRAGKRNQWCAPFTELLFMALATMNVRMTTVADVEIAHALYMKTKVGMVMDEIHIHKDGYESYFLRGYMVVNIKPFTRWVRQNINRMQRPMQECNRLEDEHQRQMEQDYYDDLEREDELRYGRHEHCDTQNCEHDDDDGGIEITDIHLDDDIEDHPLYDDHVFSGVYSNLIRQLLLSPENAAIVYGPTAALTIPGPLPAGMVSLGGVYCRIVDGKKILVVAGEGGMPLTMSNRKDETEVDNPNIAIPFVDGQMVGLESQIFAGRESLKSWFTEEQLANFKDNFCWQVRTWETIPTQLKPEDAAERAMNPDIATDVEEEEPRTIGDLIRQQLHRKRIARIKAVQSIDIDRDMDDAFRAINDVLAADLKPDDHADMMRVVGLIESYETIHYPITMENTRILRHAFETRNKIESLKAYIKRNKPLVMDDGVITSNDFNRWTYERQAEYIQRLLVERQTVSQVDGREDDSSDPYRGSPEDEARAQAEEMDRLEEQARK